MIEVIGKRCINCTACTRACAYDAITMEDHIAVINLEKCTLCGACVPACPVDAIVIHKITDNNVNPADFKGVWIFAQQTDGKIAPVTLELLGKGRELADQMETELSAVLFGSEIEGLAKELIAFGADKVIAVDDPSSATFVMRDMPRLWQTWRKNTAPQSFWLAPRWLAGHFSPEWQSVCTQV